MTELLDPAWLGEEATGARSPPRVDQGDSTVS